MDIEPSKIHELFDITQKNKIITLDKTYYVTEWSHQLLCDGRYVYKEIIRDYARINGIDCYFTNTNNRIYFKEDLYETETEAEEMCRWQNSFGYDYETKISRENIIKNFITFEDCHWRYKNE